MKRFWVPLALVVALTALAVLVVAPAPTLTVPVTAASAAANNVLPGDANDDAVVDMSDVVKEERCILELDTDCAPGADADADGDVDMGDVLTTELIIMAQP